MVVVAGAVVVGDGGKGMVVGVVGGKGSVWKGWCCRGCWC